MWLFGVVVRRYIDILIIIINFPYSTCIRSFFGSSILTSLFILKMFFRSLYNKNASGGKKHVQHNDYFYITAPKMQVAGINKKHSKMSILELWVQ